MGTTADKIEYLQETKRQIKEAVKAKGVSVSDSDTFRSYAQKIASIDTKPTLIGSASQPDVLEGFSFYSNDYNLKQGTMKNNSGKDIILNSTADIALPEGYYGGEDVVKLNDAEKQKLISSNIKQGVTILGVQGSVVPQTTLTGNATTSNVLTGKTFYSNSTTKQTGTMPNQTKTYTISSKSGITLPTGYHEGSTANIDSTSSANLVAANIRSGTSILGVTGTLEEKPALSGNANAAQVLSGKTFYSSDYTQRTGTMVNQGAKSLSPTSTSTTPIPVGYYEGATINLGNRTLVPLKGIFVPPANAFDWNAIYYMAKSEHTVNYYGAYKGYSRIVPCTIAGTTHNLTATLVDYTYGVFTDVLVFYVTGFPTQYALFESGSTTAGGWGGSSVSFRNTLNSTIYNGLPEDLKRVIVPVDVKYGIGGGGKVTTINTIEDKLFVPSLKELKGNSNYLYNGAWNTDWQPDEGTQFRWFAEDVNRIKPSSRTMTRSVPQSNRYCFIEANSTDANVIWLTTKETVAFCFVVGG